MKITEKHLKKIEKYFPKQRGNVVVDNLTFVNALLYIIENTQPRSFNTAAQGGLFSTGQMFLAREAGPELVGAIGAKSAVVNNEQIVESVSTGVYSAVKEAMKSFVGRNNGENASFNLFRG